MKKDKKTIINGLPISEQSLYNFYLYSINVWLYYLNNKSLNRFSDLAKKYHVSAMTVEQFFTFGLFNMKTPPTRELTNEIYYEIAKKKRESKRSKPVSNNYQQGLLFEE